MPRSENLIVPIQVHGIFQTEDKAVIGPEVDFESIPYYDESRRLDVNSDTPYLAEAVIPRPFSNSNFPLRKGVHLNWDFPHFLKTTKYKATDPTEFPPVPNRWLVLRHAAGSEVKEKRWLIESDALLDDLKGANIMELAQTSIDADINKERPYTYIGKVYELDTSGNRKRTRLGNTSFMTWEEKHGGDVLTAIGWGTPTFDIFYPNCNSVFGFHDREMISIPPSGINYTVIGWSAKLDDKHDYWKYYLSQREKTIEDDIIKHLNDLDHLELSQKEEQAEDTLKRLIRDDLGLEIDTAALVVQNGDKIESDLPENRMICYGKIQVIADPPEDTDRVANIKYGIGNSPTEALSALIVDHKYVGDDSGTDEQREKREDKLEAILMGDRLKSLKADIGPKFREFRHTNEFASSKGGLYWMLQKMDDNPEKEVTGNPDTKIKPSPAPASMIPLLEMLNECQRAYDKAKFELESLKASLYTDWYRYMLCAYPPPGETESMLEVSMVKDRIEKGSLESCLSAKKQLGHLLTYTQEDLLANKKEGKAGAVRTAWQKAVKELEKLTKQRIEKIAKTCLHNFSASLSKTIKDPAAKKAFLKAAKKLNKQVLGEFNKEQADLLKVIPESGITPDLQYKIRNALVSFLRNKNTNWETALNELDGIDADESMAILQLIGKDDLRSSFPIGELYHWELHQQPAPRFWEPSPPVVVMAIPKKAVDSDQDLDSDDRLRGKIIASKHEGNLELEDGKNIDVDHLLAQIGMPTTEDRQQDQMLFKADWEAMVYPAASMHPATRTSGTYDSDFILHNYFLGENEPDLTEKPDLHGSLAVTNIGSRYIGSSYPDNNLKKRYLGLLQKYENLIKDQEQQEENTQLVDHAQAFLESHELLVITLNDFNSALLQMHQSIQLNPADPLGFKEYQDFAKKVSDVLDSGKGYSPDPFAAFMPIRSGVLKLFKLRIIDSFGRFKDYRPDQISAPIAMRILDHPDWARLPPRFSQPTRINFRFLKSTQNQEASTNDQRAGTPICGWIVPDLLNSSLLFFNSSGQKVGAFNLRGDWEPIEGMEPSGYLLKVKAWLEDALEEPSSQPEAARKPNAPPKDKFSTQAFIADIEEALDTIHPEDREGQAAFSILMGRPMAVVRIGLGVEVKGLYANNVSWDDFHRSMVSMDRDTDGFEQVKIPFRLGEYRQRNDGLIGYWALDNEDELEDKFHVTDAKSAGIARNIADGDLSQKIGDKTLRDYNEAWKVQDEMGRDLKTFISDEKEGDGIVKKQDLIQPYLRDGAKLWQKLIDIGVLEQETPYAKIAHYSESEVLKVAIADRVKEFLCLMDPHGAIHVTTGVQPVKSISLPEVFIQEALEKIEVDFVTGPVLGPEAAIQLSLPKEENYEWEWQEQHTWPQSPKDSRKSEEAASTGKNKTILEATHINDFISIANFPDRLVLRDGKLILKPKKDKKTQ